MHWVTMLPAQNSLVDANIHSNVIFIRVERQ